MHTTCVNSKDNIKSNDSDHIVLIRENTRLKHRCPLHPVQQYDFTRYGSRKKKMRRRTFVVTLGLVEAS